LEAGTGNIAPALDYVQAIGLAAIARHEHDLLGHATRQLDAEGIAVPAGHHCAQPILRRLSVESSVRASLALYNTHADIEELAGALRRIRVARPTAG
jgi:cysteine desulfurase/selenocysteine lyase